MPRPPFASPTPPRSFTPGDPAPLLAPDEPEPVDVVGHEARSPFIVVCDHAGNRLPRSLGTLGLSAAELESHVAWDIGAADVARRLAATLDAFAVCQRYSRLVIDCNRPLFARDSIVVTSERTVIPGNRHLRPEDAERRARAVFHPYHDRIRAELERREREGRQSIFVAMHSFTPVFMDTARPWHVGVLYNRDARLAEPLLRLLRAEGDLVVGCNEPYALDALSDYSAIQHGEQRGIVHVEIEVRNDLIRDDAGKASWAARLGRLLLVASRALRTGPESARL